MARVGVELHQGASVYSTAPTDCRYLTTEVWPPLRAMLSGVRHSPLPIGPALFGPDARVHVGAAADQQPDDVEVTGAAGADEGVFVPGHHLVDEGAAVEQHGDDVEVTFTGSHDERVAVAGNGGVHIGAAVEQHGDDVAVAFDGQP